MTRRPPPGIDASVPVVVLKMVRDHYAHGRLAVARSLGRLGVSVYCLHESRLSPAAWSRYGHHVTWPIDDTPSPGVVDDLLRVGDDVGGRPVLVATDDVSTLFVDEHADALCDGFRYPHQPSGLALELADKGRLSGLCGRHGVPEPEAVFPRSRGDVEDYLTRGGALPVVVKSMDPLTLRRRPEAASVAIARTPAALLDLYDRSEVPDAPNLMLQEYIPGGPETVWMFNGYFDADSECLVSFTGRKIRQHPPGTGATTLGICEPNDEIEATTRRFLKAIGYRGIVDMGYRYDARDGQYKLLDVNPRLGASFRLFVGEGGMDVVRAMYLDLTGQPVPATPLRAGRRWLVEPFDVWTAREYVADGSLTWSEWRRSLRGVDEAAWFALDDPAPFLAMVALFSAQPLYRRLTRSRRIARGRSPLR